MNLLNQQVKHEHFGDGTVVDCTASHVRVRFPVGEKRFAFPDAFGTYLSLTDPETARLVEDLKKEVEKKRKAKRRALDKQRAEELAERQRELERERLLRSQAFSPASQACFWCDGEELEKVFAEWRVFTGLRKSGQDAGKPVRLVRMGNNSACLITEREQGMAEEDRRIAGVFLADETFVGKLCDDGYIPGHPKYRLRFSEEESQRLLFWNYYCDERHPLNTTWNRGRHRYFHNIWMAQILRDVVSLRAETEGEELAKEFFQHFCELNHIDGEKIPPPNGSLIRQKAQAS